MIFKLNKWLYPGIRIKRWVLLLVLSLVVIVVGFSGVMGTKAGGIRIEAVNVDHFFYRLQRLKAIDYILLALGAGGIILAFRRAYFSVLTIFAPNREKEFINLAYKQAKLKRGPKIAAIGGGTGLPNVLRGIKNYTSNISAIVTVADDGGSSGRLRKDYRMLPPGDIRNCIVALSDEEALLGRLFQYRFDRGKSLSGHSFGNIFLTALSHVVGDLPKAINETSKVLAIQGKVMPVSLDNLRLKAKLKDGRVIKGESKITEALGKIERLSIEPAGCKPYPDAVKAIQEADVVIIGPGSLYTSILPNLLVPGIKEALKNTKTLKIYICNIMTQPGETDNYSVSDHIDAIYGHVGKGVIDIVIANNKQPSQSLLRRYAKENSYPVKVDREEINKCGVALVRGALFNEDKYIRHSSELLAKLVMKQIIV
ncbi:MAG TPA: YvcK family protein [bacterium]|nr:YvcK family protein [bacterium]